MIFILNKSYSLGASTATQRIISLMSQEKIYTFNGDSGIIRGIVRRNSTCAYQSYKITMIFVTLTRTYPFFSSMRDFISSRFMYIKPTQSPPNPCFLTNSNQYKPQNENNNSNNQSTATQSTNHKMDNSYVLLMYEHVRITM